MSEIGFIREFGLRLEAAIEADAVRAGNSGRQSWGRTWLRRLTRPRHSRLLLGFVALVVAGCAAAVTLYNPATTTVAYGITCLNGNGQRFLPGRIEHGRVSGSNLAYGADPLEMCHNSTQIPVAQLTTCVQPSRGVVVLPRNGNPRPCHAAGLQPYGRRYAAAVAQVAKLEKDLLRIYASRVCWGPQQLAAAAARALTVNAFVGWTTHIQSVAESDSTAQFPGNCGDLLPVTEEGHSYLDGTLGIDPLHHTVDLYSTAPRPVIQVFTRIELQLSGLDPTSGRPHGRISSVNELRARVEKDLRSTRRFGIRLKLRIISENGAGGPSFPGISWITEGNVTVALGLIDRGTTIALVVPRHFASS